MTSLIIIILVFPGLIWHIYKLQTEIGLRILLMEVFGSSEIVAVRNCIYGVSKDCNGFKKSLSLN
jgi:hypothetical protein